MRLMSEGTKSVLFGAHSIIHSIIVMVAWKKLYGSWPSWRYGICILLHDIGYWGKDYITNKSNDGHAELGANIACWLFGSEYRHFVLGHSSAACKKFGITKSLLEAPDDYSWVIAPLFWMEWNALLENFDVSPKEWKEAVRANFYAEKKLSGTELFHKTRGGK